MPIHSQNLHIQNLVNGLVAHGINQAVICPGSRNAPLILAFSRQKLIKCYSIVDERSAGYFAMGVALKTQNPCVLICTSGTAAANFLPAICEAYYNFIPLIVLTADRPSHLIDQWDSQCIKQSHLYGNHVSAYFDFDSCVNHSNFKMEDFLAQVFLELQIKKQGIHINIPLEEPLYTSTIENVTKHFKYYSLLNKNLGQKTFENVKHLFNAKSKIIIFNGCKHLDIKHLKFIENVQKQLQQEFEIIVISDILSQIKLEHQIHYFDGLMYHLNAEFKPDILITTGHITISKSWRNWVKNNKPAFHVHLKSTAFVGNPYQTQCEIIDQNELHFFEELNRYLTLKEYQANSEYNLLWQNQNQLFENHLSNITFKNNKQIITAFTIIQNFINSKYDIHLGNSMPVRYASLLGFGKLKNIIWCNRGTSGIDGVSSTAIGYASVENSPTLLLTGDMSFAYDINAFWQTKLPENFKIIVLNNNGGGIFRTITPAKHQAEVEDFFSTSLHSKNANYICKHFQIAYHQCNIDHNFEKILMQFLNTNTNIALLEIMINPKTEPLEYQDIINYHI